MSDVFNGMVLDFKKRLIFYVILASSSFLLFGLYSLRSLSIPIQRESIGALFALGAETPLLFIANAVSIISYEFLRLRKAWQHLIILLCTYVGYFFYIVSFTKVPAWDIGFIAAMPYISAYLVFKPFIVSIVIPTVVTTFLIQKYESCFLSVRQTTFLISLLYFILISIPFGSQAYSTWQYNQSPLGKFSSGVKSQLFESTYFSQNQVVNLSIKKVSLEDLKKDYGPNFSETLGYFLDSQIYTPDVYDRFSELNCQGQILKIIEGKPNQADSIRIPSGFSLKDKIEVYGQGGTLIKTVPLNREVNILGCSKGTSIIFAELVYKDDGNHYFYQLKEFDLTTNKLENLAPISELLYTTKSTGTTLFEVSGEEYALSLVDSNHLVVTEISSRKSYDYSIAALLKLPPEKALGTINYFIQLKFKPVQNIPWFKSVNIPNQYLVSVDWQNYILTISK